MSIPMDLREASSQLFDRAEINSLLGKLNESGSVAGMKSVCGGCPCGVEPALAALGGVLTFLVITNHGTATFRTAKSKPLQTPMLCGKRLEYFEERALLNCICHGLSAGMANRDRS
jgi:hypothetical protein